MKKISLKKSLSIFTYACSLYKRKKESISEIVSIEIENRLGKLQQCIAKRDKVGASKEAYAIEKILKEHFPLSIISKFAISAATLAIAFFFAIVIRQTCFEPMEIPTGSMRPTFRENDRVIVSKAQFGINIPLVRNHFSFDPEAMKRMGTVVFTAEGLDIANVHIKHFGILPGVKRFVKRTIGLPEDTLYFYGGKIYGIDKDGNDISLLLQQEMLSHIEHIPYIYIGGRVVGGDFIPLNQQVSSITIEQNHIPVSTLKSVGKKEATASVLQNGVEDIHEMWGMGNYGMTRIVSTESLYFSNETLHLLMNNIGVKYYLEITHHASIHDSTQIDDYRGIRRPELGKSVSYIPLHTETMLTIWKNLSTSRFNTNKGYLEHFGKTYENTFQYNDRPKIKGGMDDASYEFIDGIAYKVKWQNHPFSLIPSLAIPKQVEDDHPFATFSEEKCMTLYNAGIEQSKFVAHNTHMGLAPSRYAYFRDGDFYLMGKKILSHDDSLLQDFITRENAIASDNPLYVPFIDAHAPLLSDGSIDKEKILKYGLFVPKKSYYVLGDNHAQSGDSREFGFVPEENIQGVASFMLWAPGGRFGAPLQEPYAWFTVHKLFVWSILLTGIGLYYARERRKLRFVTTEPLSTFIDKPRSLFKRIFI